MYVHVCITLQILILCTCLLLSIVSMFVYVYMYNLFTYVHIIYIYIYIYYNVGPKTIFFWAPTFKWVCYNNRYHVFYYYNRVWLLLVWLILTDLVRN